MGKWRSDRKGKSFIAIDLADFHSKAKKWQGGALLGGKKAEDFVKIQVVGGKNLEQAKKTAAYGNDNAWYVFPLDTYRSMVWAPINEEGRKARGV